MVVMTGLSLLAVLGAFLSKDVLFDARSKFPPQLIKRWFQLS